MTYTRMYVTMVYTEADERRRIYTYKLYKQKSAE